MPFSCSRTLGFALVEFIVKSWSPEPVEVISPLLIVPIFVKFLELSKKVVLLEPTCKSPLPLTLNLVPLDLDLSHAHNFE